MKFPGATDSANIFSLACKSLLRLDEELVRATDEACLLSPVSAIMRRTMLREFSISGTASGCLREAQSCTTTTLGYGSAVSQRGKRGFATFPRRDMRVSGVARSAKVIPARSHVEVVGYPTSIPPRFLGYPTEIPGGWWDIPWDLVGPRDVSPLDLGITSKMPFFWTDWTLRNSLIGIRSC